MLGLHRLRDFVAHLPTTVLTATEPNFVVMFERIGAFAVLGSLFLISYPKRPVFVFVIVFGTAIVLELAQIFIPTRDARRRV